MLTTHTDRILEDRNPGDFDHELHTAAFDSINLNGLVSDTSSLTIQRSGSTTHINMAFMMNPARLEGTLPVALPGATGKLQVTGVLYHPGYCGSDPTAYLASTHFSCKVGCGAINVFLWNKENKQTGQFSAPYFDFVDATGKTITIAGQITGFRLK